MEDFIRDTSEIIISRLTSNSVLYCLYSKQVITQEEYEDIQSLDNANNRRKLVAALRTKDISCRDKFIGIVENKTVGQDDLVETLKSAGQNFSPKVIRTEAKLAEGIWFGDLAVPWNFTGRTNELQKLHEIVLKSHNAPENVEPIALLCIVYGLTGIGKSTLAKQYAFINRNFFDRNVIWLRSESPKHLEDDYRTLAKDYLKIYEAESKNLVLLVRDVYQLLQDKRTLFIFDNVQDEIHIIPFLPNNLSPSAQRPHLLATSKIKDFFVNGNTAFMLDALDKHEALKLIENSLPRSTHQERQRLAASIGYLPLALQQAMGYIRHRTSSNSITTYLENVEEQYITPVYDNLRCKISNLIERCISVSLKQFEEDLVKLVTEAHEVLKFQTEQTEEKFIVHLLNEQLNNKIKIGIPNYITKFVEQKQIVDKEKSTVISILQDNSTKLEEFKENNANGKLSSEQLTAFHKITNDSIKIELQTKSSNNGLGFDLAVQILKKWDSKLNDCIELYKERIKILFKKNEMTKRLAEIENKLQVAEILQKYKLLLGSLAEDKELLQEYSYKLESEASAIYSIEMQEFLTKVRNSLSREFQNCQQTAKAEYTQVINRLTQKNLNNFSQAELKAFHLQAVNEVLREVSIPESNDTFGNSYEDQLRDMLNENANSMLYKKNILALTTETFLTPSYNNFCTKVSNLIESCKSESLRQFEEDLRKLKAEVCEELKSKTQRTEDECIVNTLLEQLKSSLDNDTQNNIKEFIKKKQIADEEKFMFQSVLQEHRTKMEKKLQNDKNGNLSMAGLTSTHEETKSKIIRDLEAKSKNELSVFELTLEFKTQAVQGFNKLLQGIQNYKRRAADEKLAQQLIQTYAQKYQDKINNTQWTDLNELENYQADIMTGEAQLIKDFKINCPSKDQEYLSNSLDKLQAELNTIFSKELLQMQVKFDQLKIKAEQDEARSTIKIEQDKVMLNTTMQKEKFQEQLALYCAKYNEIKTMNTPTNDVAIGIHIGTTYCYVAVYHNYRILLSASYSKALLAYKTPMQTIHNTQSLIEQTTNVMEERFKHLKEVADLWFMDIMGKK